MSAVMSENRAFFNQLRSKDGSVQHTGDNRTGAGDGDDESIVVDLNRVPAHVTTIIFVVTSYDALNDTLIVHYPPDRGGECSWGFPAPLRLVRQVGP